MDSHGSHVPVNASTHTELDDAGPSASGVPDYSLLTSGEIKQLRHQIAGYRFRADEYREAKKKVLVTVQKNVETTLAQVAVEEERAKRKGREVPDFYKLVKRFMLKIVKNEGLVLPVGALGTQTQNDEEELSDASAGATRALTSAHEGMAEITHSRGFSRIASKTPKAQLPRKRRSMVSRGWEIWHTSRLNSSYNSPRFHAQRMSPIGAWLGGPKPI
jgi:hypothetical protein